MNSLQTTQVEAKSEAGLRPFRVFFKCLPGIWWRPCSEVVEARNAREAAKKVRQTDYGMKVQGPFVAKETTDEPCLCWSPRHVSA